MDSAPSRAMLPLVAICGTTGVGKSQLAVELALRLAARAAPARWRGARVVNADAMQVYAGADVLTNKLSLPARRGVEHCLLGVRAPGSQYVVGEWVRDAVREVGAIVSCV
jgi:tRNA dimethylallyltransferase